VSEEADWIVLAQASMAVAADKLDADIPPDEPEFGFETAIRIFRNHLRQSVPSDNDHGRG
jgi:hypothetical protein